MPDEVIDVINDKYVEGFVMNTARLKLPTGECYKVEIETDSETLEILFSADGKIINTSRVNNSDLEVEPEDSDSDSDDW